MSKLIEDAGTVNGVITAEVISTKDPAKLGRVKLKSPGLGKKGISDWVRVASFWAGKNRGAFFPLEAGDEVLVTFIQGDINQPVVIGSLWNPNDKPPERNADGQNNVKLLKSRAGHTITIDDNTKHKKAKVEIKTAAGTDTAPTGGFDTPADGSAVNGSIPVTGWAIDDVQVVSVKIYRDPVAGEGNSWVYIGDAVFVEGARTDIETLYLGYPNNSSAGWGYMMLTHFLPNGGNGTFTIHAEAIDTAGSRTLLGSKTILCDNAGAVTPFGAIDTPAQGGIASGSFVNFGWALTPQPNSIPLDGSTIWVYIDDKPQGNPSYNEYRSDVASLLPGYANSNGAGGHYVIDTTAFTTGVHTIAWSVSDSAGNTGETSPRAAGAVSYVPLPAHGPAVLSGAADTSPYVSVSRGWRLLRDVYQAVPPRSGTSMFHVEIRELEPVTVLPPDGVEYDAAGLFFNGGIRSLPPGAGLNPATGAFRWIPGPGFTGPYTVILSGARPDGTKIVDTVIVTIKPKFSVGGETKKLPAHSPNPRHSPSIRQP